MKHIRFFAVFGILISILASCSFFSAKGDTGVIHIQLGASTARSMEEMPMPAFGSASIIISGPGMATRTITLSQEELLIPQSIEVPAGPNRRVQIYAKPDWEATTLLFSELYPNTVFIPPSLAQAYGANAVVEVVPNTSTDVNLVFSLVETKILLPSYAEGGNISNLKTTDSFNGSVSDQHESFNRMIDSNTQFAFDRYGGLFFTKSEYNHTIYYAENEETLYTSPAQGGALPLYTSASEGSFDIAYDHSNNYLYFIDFVNFINLYRMDLSQIDTETSLPLVEDLGTLFDENDNPLVADNSQIAVDNDGYVYFTSIYTEGEEDEFPEYMLVKLQVGSESLTVIESTILPDLGLYYGVETNEYYSGYYNTINDMIIRDGRLFIAVSHEDYYNEYEQMTQEDNYTGKIMEIRLSDLALVRSYGGGETTPPDASSTRLFGPTRFLGFGPRRLYFSDEAVVNISVSEGGGEPYTTEVGYNRLVELNLDTGAIQVRPVDEASEAYFFIESPEGEPIQW